MSEHLVSLAIYDGSDRARDAFDRLVDLGSARRIALRDAAVVAKTPDGSVEILDETKGAGTADGVVAGAFLGLLFPPSLVVSAAAGGAVGGVLRHVTRSLSRRDVMELGEVLDRGRACLIAVSDDASQEIIADVTQDATERISRRLDVDAEALQRALEEAGHED